MESRRNSVSEACCIEVTGLSICDASVWRTELQVAIASDASFTKSDGCFSVSMEKRPVELLVPDTVSVLKARNDFKEDDFAWDLHADEVFVLPQRVLE